MKSRKVVWLTHSGQAVREPIYDKMISTLWGQHVITTHADIVDYVWTHHKAHVRVVKHDGIFMDFDGEEEEMAWALVWS